MYLSTDGHICDISLHRSPFICRLSYFFETRRDYSPNYYDNIWFGYLPSFYFQFFWIGYLGFLPEIILWILINSVLLGLVWQIIIQEKFFTSWEKKAFILIVLGFGLFFEVPSANTDIILLFCGFVSYFLLDYGRTVSDESKKKQWFIEFCAGSLFAFGLFKPLILVWLPILVIKSKKPSTFFGGLVCWRFISNLYFVKFPDYFIVFINIIRSGQTINVNSNYYQISAFNYLWKMAYSGFRHQIYIFPALLLYSKHLIKKERFRQKIIQWYCVVYPVFEITGLFLFYTGF